MKAFFQMLSLKFVLLIFACAVFGCKKEFNVMSPLVTKQDKDFFDSAIAQAKYYYDIGEFDLGVHFAEVAQRANPSSETAALLLGYLYLAQIDIYPFSFIKKLSNNSSSQSTDTSTESSSSSKSAFKAIDQVISFSRSDIDKLGSFNTEDPQIPVLEPFCANRARRILTRLEMANQIIKISCPFVSQSAKKITDPRHQCEDLTGVSQAKNQALFLWVISHMIESLYFYNVLSYSTINDSNTNLELKAKKIQAMPTSTPSEVVAFTASMKSLNSEIKMIFPSDLDCSSDDPQTQALALVNDVYAMNEGMKLISVLPDSFKSKFSAFSDSLTPPKIDSTGSEASSAEITGLRKELTKNMSESLFKKLESLDKSEYTQAEVDDLCSSYSDLSGQDSEKTPTICQ